MRGKTKKRFDMEIRYRHILAALLLVGVGMWSTSCERALPVYDLDADALNFDVSLDGATNEPKDKLYSFVYIDEAVMEDTVWITLNTQGFVTAYDRAFRLRQVEVDTVVNAVPGVHYTSFDSAEMQKYCVVPAGANTVKVPVIVHRDPSLEENDVRLNIEVLPNENFVQGVKEYRLFPLVISNMLTKPANWQDYYFGTYGPVKHRFMINQTGLRWDEDFLKEILAGDYGYIKYLTMLLYQRLEAENADRKAKGLDVLKEANGKKVAFDYGGSF